MTSAHYVAVNADDIKNFARLSVEAQDRAVLAAIQIKVRIVSLEIAQRDYILALGNYHDACIQLADDDNDDFETASLKADKWRGIEHDFTQAGQRIGFELREAAKFGIH